MSDATTTLLNVVGKLPDLFRSARADSLVRYTKGTRVEPVTLIDRRALHLPYTGDVLQVLNSLFAGYYLQAVAISVNVGKIDTVRLLDKVNPNRDPMDNAGMFIGDMVSEESYRFALPIPGRRTGIEAYGGYDLDDKDQIVVKQNPIEGSKFGSDSAKAATEVANLAVGKLIDVHIEQCGHKAVIPVNVRLATSTIESANLVHILSHASQDLSVKERYHGWRSGSLELIKDTIFCQDLIDSHRKALMGDASGVYQQSLDRNKKNKLSAILSGAPSIATASNLVVMTSDTARELENLGSGKLKDFRFRQRVFQSTYVMILCVIDTAYEQVTFYTRDIESASTHSVKEIKQKSGKNNSVDVAEILKAYQLGNSPSL